MGAVIRFPSFIRPRPEPVIGWPAFSQTFNWTGAAIPEPGLRKRSTPIGKVASVKFKSIEHAQVCRINLMPGPAPGADWLSLEPDMETREVRLLAPLDLAGALSALPHLAPTTFTVTFALAGSAETRALQQVAILARGPDRELFPWRKLGHGIDPRAPGPHSWTFSAGGPDDPPPVETYLCLQLPPGSGPVSIGPITLFNQSVGTGTAGFNPGSAVTLEGWLQSADGGRSAWISATAEDRPPVQLRLIEPSGLFTVGRKAEMVRFSVPRDALALALGGGDHHWKLVLFEDQSPVAQAMFRPSVQATAGSAPALTAATEDPHPAPVMTAPVVAALDVAAMAELLASSSSPSLSREVPRLLYNQKALEKLWGLHALLIEPAPEAASRWAYLDFFLGRAMLEMNAAETAFNTFTRLVSDPDCLGALNATDARRARHHLARSCLRTGRVAEAVQHLRDLSIDDPTDWESYFQLGVIISREDPKLGSLYFRLSEELSNKFPTSSRLILIDALISEGRAEDALAKTLIAMKVDRGARELQLCLANAYRALGRPMEQARCIDSFFAFYDLSTPGAALTGPAQDRPGPRPADVTESGPRVTVIMTAFNSESTIEASILSVLAQTYQNLRLVVVDDVSSDGTCALVRDLSRLDPRLTLLEQPANGGTYRAKNRAILETPSDYFTFHDSDDWMHPQHIAEHVALMEAEPQIACSTSLWYRMDDEGHAIVRRAGHILHENPASTFVRARVIEEVGYFDSVRAGADSEFLWRIRRQYGAQGTAEIPKPLSVGLHHAQSITQSGVAAFDEHRFSAVRLEYWESWVGWHRQASVSGVRNLFVAFPQDQRPFPAPDGLING
ncbi:MAG: glycosyltransferase family A protein [Caulobacter sp.]|nr:glycosyltransferase family A protein [Caulobacter sp.]